jgi:ATP-dependent Clp protease protease subunit
LLLTAGKKGKRFSLPNARIMVHQPHVSGLQGQATDIEIHAKELLNTRSRINQIYVTHTGQGINTIETALERDRFMDPHEAKDFGLIDEIITHRPIKESKHSSAPSKI